MNVIFRPLAVEDLAVVAERREEPTIPHEQFVSDLG